MIIGIISIIISLAALYIAYKAKEGSSNDAAKQIASIRKSSLIMLDAQISAIDIEIARIYREYDEFKFNVENEEQKRIHNDLARGINISNNFFSDQKKIDQIIEDKGLSLQKQIDILVEKRARLIKQKQELVNT